MQKLRQVLKLLLNPVQAAHLAVGHIFSHSQLIVKLLKLGQYLFLFFACLFVWCMHVTTHCVFSPLLLSFPSDPYKNKVFFSCWHLFTSPWLCYQTFWGKEKMCLTVTAFKSSIFILPQHQEIWNLFCHTFKLLLAKVNQYPSNSLAIKLTLRRVDIVFMLTPSGMFLLLFKSMISLPSGFPLEFLLKRCVFGPLLISVRYLEANFCFQICLVFLHSEQLPVCHCREFQMPTANCLEVSHLLHT